MGNLLKSSIFQMNSVGKKLNQIQLEKLARIRD